MNPRKRDIPVLIPAHSLVVGQWIVANSGDIKQVTPAIKRALPAHVAVRAYA